MSNRKSYLSDLTDGQWDLLRPLLPKAKTIGRPTTVDRRDLLDAIFYILRTGCQWRQLPHDFPPLGHRLLAVPPLAEQWPVAADS